MDLSLLGELKERLSCGGMGKPALVGIVVVLAVVVAVAGFRLVGAAAASDFQVTSGSASSSASDETSSSAASERSSLFVHVSGEVNKPGLCEVESGARVAAAIDAAGGFTEEAAADSVNLAREVADGEQIVVAKKLAEGEAVAAAAVAQPGVVAGGGASSGLVNINTASESELKSLPGIGDVLAAKIVADRQVNGAFKSVEELKRVEGVGAKKYEALSGLICV